MASTPRRSTRGQVFTPVAPSVSLAPANANTTYSWLSSAKSTSEDGRRTYYTKLKRVVAKRGGKVPVIELKTRGKPLRRARSKSKSKASEASEDGDDSEDDSEEDEDEDTESEAGPSNGKRRGEVESRFAVGDGVAVAVQGGNEGIGVLTALWEEMPDEDDEEEEEEEDDGPRKMAQIHWFFRKEDLPGIMKNLQLDENEVLLAASPTRPVTTDLPVSLLIKTVPIYSKQVFKEQFPDVGQSTKWKGWSYSRAGVYWCARAYDKGARGGKVWKVDVDAWKWRGRSGEGWDVPPPEEEEEEESEAASAAEDSDDAGSDAAVGDSDGDEEASSGEDEDEVDAKPKRATRKRGRPPATPRKTKRVKLDPAATPRRRKQRAPHAKASASRLPSTVPIESLPADPYERALRLLHVGATPESLPCREEEFVDVLSRVEEGVESGGGGCLYIAGVPGTGKTATVHAVVKELKRKAEDGELAPFSYVEINGLKIPTPQHAYTVLWESISGQQGASTKTALRGLEAHFGRKGGNGVRGPRGHTFVVLMDELDQLLTAKQDVVYNFFNWPTMRDSQLFVIAIANRMDLPQHLAAKIKSRLGLQTLLFQPYDRASLIEIVQSRLIPHPASAEDHKVLMPDAISLAATKMAGTNGDARRVLDACRRAVEVALTQQPPRPVNARDMVAVLNAMSSSPVALFIRQCSPQQKMLLAALVRCVRREGMPEIPWRAVRTDHDALTRSLAESNDLLSDAELALVRTSLLATHALTAAPDMYKSPDERRLALGMEIGEVGRVLMNEGEAWRRALAGT